MLIGDIPAGEFIRQARKQLKWSQFDLGMGIVDRSKISKIESGEVIPSYDTLVQLVERLGFDADIITHAKNQAINQLEAYTSSNNIAAAEALIKKLEKDDIFMDNLFNKQALQASKVAIAIINKDPIGKIRAMVIRGLDITIPNFDEAKVADYLLTKTGIKLLNQLSIVYWDSNEKEKAIQLMEALVANFEMRCSDNRHKARILPTLLFNLTSYLHDIGEYKKAILLCEKGIAACVNLPAFPLLPHLITNKAACLYNLRDIDGSKALFEQAFHIFAGYNNFEYKEIIRKEIAQRFD